MQGHAMITNKHQSFRCINIACLFGCCFIDFRKGGREERREGGEKETLMRERDTMISLLPYMPQPGLNPQPF